MPFLFYLFLPRAREERDGRRNESSKEERETKDELSEAPQRLIQSSPTSHSLLLARAILVEKKEDAPYLEDWKEKVKRV